MTYSVLDTRQRIAKKQYQGYFTVEDAVIQKVGLVPAAVYGLIKAYCNMKHGCCYASHEALGRRLGLSRSTVWRAIQELLAAGLIMDVTPGARKMTHIYVTRDLVMELPKRNTENDSPKFTQTS